jgi:hypothetical protein
MATGRGRPKGVGRVLKEAPKRYIHPRKRKAPSPKPFSEALRERCRKVLGQIQTDGMLRQGDPVQTLFDFILAERGAAHSPEIAESKAVILYYEDEDDRTAMIDNLRKIFDHDKLRLRKIS